MRKDYGINKTIKLAASVMLLLANTGPRLIVKNVMSSPESLILSDGLA
jgi:hypothetical protein